MGNNHSTPNHHNRLTKPKTNTNSPDPALLTADSSVTLSTSYADLSVNRRQQIRESLLSPIPTNGGPPSPSKGDTIASESAPRVRGRTSTVVSRSHSRSNSRSNSLSCFASKHGSSTRLNEPNRPNIANGQNNDLDVEEAIRLLRDVKRSNSVQGFVDAHGTSEDAESEQGLSRRLSRANGSTSSLTRRRSLVQTPGVATRISPVEGRRQTWNSWKAPDMAPEVAAKWTPSLRTRNAVKPVVALDPAQGKNSSPTARTPGELEYTHLGGLKLGTLSIVNGAPSPAPSAKLSKSKSRAGMEEDYFSIVEGGSSLLAERSARKRGHMKGKSAVLTSTGTLYGNINFQKSLPRLPQIADPQEKYASTKQAIIIASKEIIIHRAELPSRDAGAYAESYRAELPSDPFKQSSGYNHAHKDEGFAGDDITPGKEQPVQILTSTAFDAPTTAAEAFGSTLFPATSPTVITDQDAKESPRPQPRTVDSGYSSGGSLRKPSQPADAIMNTTAFVNSHPRRSGARGPIAYSGTRQPVVPIQDSPTSESHASPSTPRSVTSRASFDSTTSSSNGRRLQKRRSSQPEVLVVQSCQPIPEGNIPDVPDNVRAKFIRRLSHTPDMECLTHTYPSKDHVVVNEEATEPSTSPIMTVSVLAELDSRPPTPPPHGLRKSLSRFRRKSMGVDKETETRDENASIGVVDLGTIACSLGSSPYDAAMPNTIRNTITSPTHPHQLGKTLPRAKSMVGMGPEAAVEYARVHSKDRTLMERERSQQRRKSHHNIRADVGEIQASKRRPQGALHDVPPVPVLDTSKLKVPRSVRPRLEGESPMPRALIPGICHQLPSHKKSASQIVSREEHGDHNSPQYGASWDVHAPSWSQRRKSIGEGLRSDAGFSEAPASILKSRDGLQPANTAAAWGRYSGGLDYNYEHGVGVSGSAGTRQQQLHASQKSTHWKHQYGVDMTDVPIMLQRVPA